MTNNLWDIYSRNVLGVFRRVVEGPDMDIYRDDRRRDARMPLSDWDRGDNKYGGKNDASERYMGAFRIYAWIVKIIFLPITLIFLPVIKSLIDFFSRKELPEKNMENLNDKIERSDENEIDALVQDIFTYDAQSISSNKLIEILIALRIEAIKTNCWARGSIKMSMLGRSRDFRRSNLILKVTRLQL